MTFCAFFFDNVTPEPTSGCWLWSGTATAAGYGTLRVDGKSVYAHRMSWLMHRGEVPKLMFVCHRCDNPACVNPDHLFLGTQADNVHDMDAKGRRRTVSRRGDEHPGTKISSADVLAIREARSRGEDADEIAARFGVCRNTVYNIARGTTWAHVK